MHAVKTKKIKKLYEEYLHLASVPLRETLKL
jgi:hypothetical protein